MKKISMQFILRIIAIIVFIGGAFIGYDVGDKMVTINHVISYQFSVIDALIVWFIVKAKLFCPEIAGLFCRIAGLFCHDSRANLSLKPVCFGIAIS